MRCAVFSIMLGLTVAAWAGRAAEAPSQAELERKARAAEAEALAKFNKDYAAAEPLKRKAALELLKGSAERATWTRLSQVFTLDPDPTVQNKAMEVLCTGVDKDGSLAQAVAMVSNEVKRADRKLEVAEAICRLEFKHAPMKYMVTNVMQALSYPLDPARTTANTATYANELKLAENARAEFRRFLAALNTLSGQQFEPGHKIKHEIKDWWAKTGEMEMAALDKKLKEEKKKK